MENLITFDQATCKKCKLCSEVCPCKIIVQNQDGEMAFRPDRIHVCLKCGQCMAVCPGKAISVKGLSYETDFFEFPDDTVYPNAFYKLIATRRAVRNFADKPVPEEMLKKIVDAITFAPPGFPPIKVEVVVISKPQIIKKALPLMIDLYDQLLSMFKKPIFRYFIKREVGHQRFLTLKNHLIPLLKTRMKELHEGTEDTLTRGAPALLLFCGRKDEEDIKEDAFIATTYATLAAHSLGLGSTIMSIIPPAIEKSKELRKLFDIKENTEIISSVIVGFPKYKYARGIKRKIQYVRWY